MGPTQSCPLESRDLSQQKPATWTVVPPLKLLPNVRQHGRRVWLSGAVTESGDLASAHGAHATGTGQDHRFRVRSSGAGIGRAVTRWRGTGVAESQVDQALGSGWPIDTLVLGSSARRIPISVCRTMFGLDPASYDRTEGWKVRSRAPRRKGEPVVEVGIVHLRN
jgi:hypothetical protein